MCVYIIYILKINIPGISREHNLNIPGFSGSKKNTETGFGFNVHTDNTNQFPGRNSLYTFKRDICGKTNYG